MCIDMGGGLTLSGKAGSQGVHGGFTKRGGSQGVHKKWVHVNHVTPPWLRACIFGLTQEWLRELSFSRLECGVHDKLHISSADWWDLLLPLA